MVRFLEKDPFDCLAQNPGQMEPLHMLVHSFFDPILLLAGIAVLTPHSVVDPFLVGRRCHICS